MEVFDEIRNTNRKVCRVTAVRVARSRDTTKNGQRGYRGASKKQVGGLKSDPSVNPIIGGGGRRGGG